MSVGQWLVPVSLGQVETLARAALFHVSLLWNQHIDQELSCFFHPGTIGLTRPTFLIVTAETRENNMQELLSPKFRIGTQYFCLILLGKASDMDEFESRRRKTAS